MDMDFKVAEVTLQYRPICKKQGRGISSEEAYSILLPTFREGRLSTGNMLKFYISTKQTR